MRNIHFAAFGRYITMTCGLLVAASSGAQSPISASAMYQEFQRNPVDASNKYVGKAPVMEGIVSKILLLSDGVGAAVHIADNAGPARALILDFPNRNVLTGVSVGTKLRFRCTVSKFEHEIVWMARDCEVVGK